MLPCIACAIEVNTFGELKSHYENIHPHLVKSVEMDILNNDQQHHSNSHSNHDQIIPDHRNNWPNIASVLSSNTAPSNNSVGINPSDNTFPSNSVQVDFHGNSSQSSNIHSISLSVTCKRDTLLSNTTTTQVIPITAKMASYYLCCNTG